VAFNANEKNSKIVMHSVGLSMEDHHRVTVDMRSQGGMLLEDLMKI